MTLTKNMQATLSPGIDPEDLTGMKIADTLLHEENGDHRKAHARAMHLSKTCSGLRHAYLSAAEAIERHETAHSA